MHVPFLDLATQYQSIRDEILSAIQKVLDSTKFIQGPEIEAFEAEFADAHGRKFGIATNNGTSSLHLALWALGIGRGDEVLVPVNTFIATAEAVMLTGATPVFVDHDDFYGMDAEHAASQLRRRTKLLLPVHLYGQPADMPALMTIAARRTLPIVEDAAQAHLARLHDQFVGSWSAAACFSFYPGKNLGAYGEAGAVISDDAELVRQMRLLRDHGSESKYVHKVSGHNYRLEALQGAILRVKLRYLARWTQMRQERAARYAELLRHIPEVLLPGVRQGAEPVYHLYVIQADRRDDLKEFLAKLSIDTGLHYPMPLHRQQAFADLGYKEGAFPCAEASAKRILSLPMYPELTNDQQDFVAQSIAKFYGHTL
jgi:dTDP-4-amino-4,6-dideoxygalactose transaminase